MDSATFWNVLEEARAKATGNAYVQVELVADHLKRTTTPYIREFWLQRRKAMDQAYSWDLWGAATIMMGFCSDDGFENFRLPLSSKRRSMWKRKHMITL
ncbi:DUF4240 domain-containing protein [Thermoactinospora rubra]|uniref:DUF4240 domain-containing protein n=1 Tax=Thermoactinospora rubra TaxID=1088767 RepID=UPI000A1144E2|nr:DUF4240 domain-containing protein [Thermoactinospora rubra]